MTNHQQEQNQVIANDDSHLWIEKIGDISPNFGESGYTTHSSRDQQTQSISQKGEGEGEGEDLDDNLPIKINISPHQISGEEFVDYFDNLSTKKMKVLDHGSVEIIDVMPRVGPFDRTPEHRIVEAARTSMGGGLKNQAQDERLIRYLYNNHHTSPFEMVKISFVLVIPEVFATHILRHRSLKFSNVNAYSLRYSEALEETYTPSVGDLDDIHNFYSPNNVNGGIRVQDGKNKQLSKVIDSSSINPTSGGDQEATRNGRIISLMEEANKIRDLQYQKYKEMLDAGIPRETARLWLPNSKYTRLFITMDLHNFLNFCFLRADFEHAQWETAIYTQAMMDLVRPLFPITLDAFQKKHKL